jgi:hypothetical protein
LEQALKKGANLIRTRVDEVNQVPGGLQVKSRGEGAQSYDLLAVAAGVNTAALKLFPPLETGYRPPVAVQTNI